MNSRNSDVLYKEIREQPAVAEALIKEEFSNVKNIAKEIKGQFEYILIAARGSSDNAGRYAQYLFGNKNGIQVALATPSLFTLYESPPNLKNALVISISQSGQSPDIVSIVSEAKTQGCQTICITNDAKSPLAKASAFTIPVHAGEEKAVAATKSYTSSLIALAMLSSALLDDNGFELEISSIPGKIKETLDLSEQSLDDVQRYRYMGNCAVLGRGLNYGTSFEVALKVKELTGVNANPYSSADFRHGPIATVHKGFPVILIAPHGKVFKDMYTMFQDLKSLDAEIISISNEEEIVKESNLGFMIPSDISECISPILSVIPGQYLARQLAIEKNLDPDKPEGLRKVTETF